MTTLEELCSKDVPPLCKQEPKKRKLEGVCDKDAPAACKQALQSGVFEIPTPGPAHFADLKYPRAAAGDAGYAISHHGYESQQSEEWRVPWYKHPFLRSFLKSILFFGVSVKIAKEINGLVFMK